MSLDASQRLILALDVPSADDAKRLLRQLDGVVSFCKVGLEIFTASGPDLVKWLVSQDTRVFLDLKLLDIERTVRRATAQAAGLGVSFLPSAVEGARGSDLKVLAVTVLTSWDAGDLHDAGIHLSVGDLVLRSARKALRAGSHGVIASGREAASLREQLGNDFLVVTPGIRPAGASTDEQKRVTTPADAIRAGADYLVVGRPITQALNPKDAALRILDEMQTAFDALPT